MGYTIQDSQHFKLQPRIIIHGGAGNIQRENYPPEKYQSYRDALITVITKTNAYMTTPAKRASEKSPASSSAALLPSALDVATFAVTLLEDNPLFNSGHGAVFTRDGVNELEASVMVSRGRDKRGVGVMGLRRVRNPIVLARAMLEHGQDDLRPRRAGLDGPSEQDLDVPSAQGHTQLFGAAAEQLAAGYGLNLVDPGYFFTQQRWDEHQRALGRERNSGTGAGATWSAEEYLPQGTCGAVALDEDGVICVATSTGGMTNKLTGRIGDTPVVGAGFWAEEWTEDGDPTGASAGVWRRLREVVTGQGPSVVLGDALAGALADCLPTPRMYTPLPAPWPGRARTTRSMGGSGTGNGDSFLRINALRTVGAMARWKPETSAAAVTRVAGPGGELELSAGDRWGRTGEGEGGIIGIECAVIHDAAGRVVDARSEILMDYNCGGMFRAWIDDRGRPVMSIWTNGASDDLGEQVTGGKR
ncbi:nucleophile aminohydrolase [Dactylonectria estremocensis]|uniref:Nucleophile aminohydrolase n=1 Tax=Dactylonectria estremocensis TaxID=1079267 RepID=A0A9P9J6Y8_9HYPO|nr:nucleophile aminohydrolase [Dactylonectria estremocensis]